MDLSDSKQELIMKGKKKRKGDERGGKWLLLLAPVCFLWSPNGTPYCFLLIHLWADRGASCETQLACCATEWQSSIKTIISKPISHLLLNLWKVLISCAIIWCNVIFLGRGSGEKGGLLLIKNLVFIFYGLDCCVPWDLIWSSYTPLQSGFQ